MCGRRNSKITDTDLVQPIAVMVQIGLSVAAVFGIENQTKIGAELEVVPPQGGEMFQSQVTVAVRSLVP